MILEFIFFFMLFIILHSYVFYPILIILLERKNEESENFETPISILIAAYNEEKVIEERINNILLSNYHMNLVEILVGSDCSSDSTNEILTRLEKDIPNLKVFLFEERGGKAGVINKLVKFASNEILVFTDANTEFKKDSLNKVISDFSNSEVGCVSGRLILTSNESFQDKTVEEKSYWNYESAIKKAEGSRGILIGANGGFFAIRKKLFREIPIKKAVTDDFFISLNALNEGYKVNYKSDALAIEAMGKTVEAEYKRKVRFSATNFQTILFFPKLILNKNLLLSFALWSHKIFRWIIPSLLPIVYLINVLLIENSLLIKYMFYAQSLFYLLSLLGFISSKLGRQIKIFSLPYFFIVANIAVLHGFFRFLNKKHSVVWQSTER